MRVKSGQRACASVSNRKATCPLNHTQMSVYYRKGRVREEAMDSMCCGWAFSRSHSVYRHTGLISALVFQAGRRWFCLHVFPCHLRVWLIILLRRIGWSAAECVCPCVCVGLTGSGDLLFVRLHPRGQTLPGSRRAASARLSAFSYDPCAQARGPVC